MSETDPDAAFRATDYRVGLGEAIHVLRIGAPCPQPIANWLRETSGVACGWLITAHNPGARPADKALNDGADAALASLTQRDGLHALASVHRAHDGRWPDEPGRLLAGLSEDMARSLGRRFGQAAIVAVPVDGRPCALIWL